MKMTRKISGMAALAAVLWLGGGALQAQGLPAITFSTLFGTEFWDQGNAVAVDAEGYTYMVGHSEISWYWGLVDAFIVKFAPSGDLVWSVRLGGSRRNEAVGVAVRPGGDIWVVGWTDSPDFPVVAPWQPTGGGGPFLVRLNAAGEVVLSTIFGGPGGVGVDGIGTDAQGFVYLAGFTDSPSFPPGTRGTGSSRSYVIKIDPAGPRILWGAEVENPDSWSKQLSGFAVDPTGRSYLGWYTQTARLSASGSPDYLVPAGSRYGLAADAAGNAYLLSTVGRIESSTSWAWSDVLVERLGPSGELTGSLAFGGSWDDTPGGIAADPAGGLYVVGETYSADFPVQSPVQPTCPDADEWLSCWPVGFLTRIEPETWSLQHSTYLGGTQTVTFADDYTSPRAVAAGFGAVAVTGWTTDGDFMVVNPFQSTVAGWGDAFLTRIAFSRPPDCSAAAAIPAALWPPNGRLAPVSIQGVTDPDRDPVTLRVTAIHQDEPLSKTGTPDATGLGTAQAWVRADRAGNGDGRVYHIAFEATDPAGAACTGTMTVCVPHDQGKPACADGGPLVDSAGDR